MMALEKTTVRDGQRRILGTVTSGFSDKSGIATARFSGAPVSATAKRVIGTENSSLQTLRT